MAMTKEYAEKLETARKFFIQGSMRVEVVSVWEVITNSDTTKGRERDVSLGIYANRMDALEAAHKKGVMGTDADVRAVDVVKHTNIGSFTNPDGGPSLVARIADIVPLRTAYENPRILREKALAKLTPIEREVLGLKDTK